jgi:hypothetical protein
MLFRMAMKALSFLRCGMVIVLLLFAGRAGAQIDSNAKVRLFCSPIVLECYGVPIVHYPEGMAHVYANPIAWVGFDTSLRFQVSDSIYCKKGFNYCFEQASLIVDTISKCFRHLVFSSSNPSYGWGIPCRAWFCPEESSVFFQMSIDSLPYIDSLGIISASGVFNFSESLSAQYNCNCHNQWWSGSCDDSGKVMDSITIEIIPDGYLSVSQLGTLSEARPLAIVGQGTESVLCTFSSSENIRMLEIYDLLGRNSAIIPIPSGAEYFQFPIVSLPPGCYFARLGDQVAKFVVPPR